MKEAIPLFTSITAYASKSPDKDKTKTDFFKSKDIYCS